MGSVGAYEAKTHLPRLLTEVSQGRSVTITKHGVAIARLVPVEAEAVDVVDVIGALKKARVGISLGDESLRELIEAGRR